MCCKHSELNNYLYIALDYEGNIVVVTDTKEYPNVFVDDDSLITFMKKDVTEFTKPEEKLIFRDNGIYENTW